MPTSPRSTLSLPLPRIEQLHAIAAARGIASPVALIEAWIGEAIDRGEIDRGIPGFSAMWDDDVVLVTIAGHTLPGLEPKRARFLAAALSAMTGDPDPDVPYTYAPGRPVIVQLGPVNVAISRVGTGVRILVKPIDALDQPGTALTAPPAFIAELAREIRAELTSPAP